MSATEPGSLGNPTDLVSAKDLAYGIQIESLKAEADYGATDERGHPLWEQNAQGEWEFIEGRYLELPVGTSDVEVALATAGIGRGVAVLGETYQSLRALRSLDDIALPTEAEFADDLARFHGQAASQAETKPLPALRAGDVPFDKAKLAKIEANLNKEGATFTYDDAALAKEGAAGAYRPGSGGKPGEIVLPTNPSRSAVIEELYHLGQHRRTGWSPHFAKTKTLYKAAEVDAQKKLLGMRNFPWTPAESQRIADALKFWSTW